MAEQNPFAHLNVQPAAAPQPSARPMGVVSGPAPSERRAEESLDIQRSGEARQQRGEQRDIEQRTFERGGKLYDQYVGRTAVKMYEAAWPAFTSAISQPDTTQGNRALIYNAIKIFDPEGAVPSGDIEGIESSSPILQRIIRSSGRLLDQGGNLPPEQRKELLDALHQRITTLRGPYNLVRSDFERRSRNIGIDPLDTIGSSIDQADADIYQNWLKQQQPAPAAGGGGPTVTVPPEESIAEFGELAYDKNGNLVGRAYSQSGAGVYYNSKGEEVGIIRGVAEEKVQEPAPSFFGGIARNIGEAVTGSERSTATTEGLPDWVEMPEMQQLFSIPTFKAALGTAFGGGPQEIAQIVQSNFPGTEVFQDEKGNYILRSPSTGQRYAIKPGFQLSDVPRALSILLTGAGGRGAGVAQTALREGALQTGIEATQATTGGTFNPEDIAMAGVGGGVLQKAGEVLPYAAGRVVGTMRRGTAPTPVMPQGVPELPGGLTRPGGGVTPTPAPMAPVAPTGAAGEITTAPRMFEAGETSTSRAGGAMGTSPETIRVQRAEDLPVPVNLAKFQRTRAFEDMQRARELAKNNEVGGPIRERLAQQQQQIAANFDSFLERTGSEIWDNLEDQGVAVSDALRKMAARDKTRINALYKKAKNSEEAQAKVPLAEAVEINVDGEPYVGSLIDYLNSQPTGVPSSAVSDTARQFAVNLGIATRGPDGQLIAANPTVGNLEGFRREMSGIAGDATGRRQEKIIKDLVDAHTEPYAGNLYREARAARRNYAERYENMSLISNLIGTKKNSPESVIAAEKVVDRILSASTDLQNLRQLRDILQSDNAGQQAWREIQGAAIESLRGKAYPNGAVRDEAGNQVIAPAAFAKEVGRLDKAGKLDVIFDNKTANHLRTLADVTQDVFTAPPGSVNFSNTSSGWLNAADAVFNTIVAQIPLPDGAFSRILGPASKYIFKAKERKTLKKEVRELLD